MKNWSLKVKVGVYAALLTMVALAAGAAVLMPVLYFHQIAQLDATLKNDADELLRDLQNFRGAPVDPRRPLGAKFIPLSLRGRFLIVEGPEGQVLYQSPNLRGTRLEGKPGETVTTLLFGRNCRIGAWQEGPYLIRIGTRLGTIERFQKDLRRGILISLPVVGLVVFFGGHWLGRRAVAPVADLSAAAERISAAAPQERLPMPAANDEIARLTEVLNRSFDRLQSSYESATRFSADASHQLKTPVAVLRAGLDHLSRETGLTGPQAAEIAVLRQQTRRLTALIDDLLLLAQADAGRLALEAEEIDLVPLIGSVCDALAPLAHLTTWLTVAAERAVSRAMGGSCSMPLAAHGTFTQGVLQLDAAWGDPEDKAPLVRAQASAPVTTLAQAEALGDAIAQRLRAGGARGATPA